LWYQADVLEHRLAKLAAAATFVLLLIGGTVNATGSSLACPEAFVICHHSILPKMEGGVLYEHGHRLAAMTVGLTQIALTILLLVRRPRERKLGVLLLGMVLVQGLFGATTVALKLRWYISTTHLILGMSYFAMLIYTAFRTRREPDPDELARETKLRDELGPARRWIGIACGFVLFQVLLGGLVRHTGAALACLGMPSCTVDGTYFPDAGIQQLHMLHRLVGCITAVVTTVAAIQVYRAARHWPQLRLLVGIAPVLVAGQIALGVLTVLSLREVPIAVAHFAGAMSLWAVWMSAWLLTGPRVREHTPMPVAPSLGGLA
jgi:heme A synthase